jgi:3-hydroxybutyryl-CoA dehydratase
MITPPPIIGLEARAITQERIVNYANASGDRNPIHIDQSFAAETVYGRTIAHGMLVLSMVSEMMTEYFGLDWIENGKLKVRFKAPAYPEDYLTAKGILRKSDPNKKQFSNACITYRVFIHNQNNEELVVGEAIIP